MKYKLQQRGAGFYSLCESCNSRTGSWYGAEYNIFAWTLAKLLMDNKDEFKINKNVHILLEKTKPLAIIKQMLSMFCSINRENFADKNLRDFLLNIKKEHD